MQFNKPALEKVRADIEQALASVAAKHGIQLTLGNIRFSMDRFTAKIEGQAQGALSREEENYDRHRERLGLPPRGTEVTSGKKPYTITGMSPRGKVIVSSMGVEYTMTIPSILSIAKSAGNQEQTPSMDLDKFVAATNEIWQQGQSMQLRTTLPPSMLEFYHRQGYTPAATVASILEEQKRELDAERKMS